MKRLIILFLLIPSICFGANVTINDLTDLGAKPATDDEFVLWDSSAGATKKVDYSFLSDLQNVDEYGGLVSAVASFGATEVTLLINTTQTVSDNLSIPTTMDLFILRDGAISIASAKVLTINGSILAGAYQIFEGSGTVTNNYTAVIYGAWVSGGSGVVINGTTPTLTVGDGGAEDTKIIYDGNAQDFYVGLDDTNDILSIGLGAGVGLNAIIQFKSDKDIEMGNFSASGSSNGMTIDGSSTLKRSSSRSSTSSAEHLVFHNPNGEVGSISTSSTDTIYATTSDYRLKENINPMFGSIVKLKQLNPVNYRFKKGKDVHDGFLAHEVQAIEPNAVVGEKDKEKDVKDVVLSAEGEVIAEKVKEEKWIDGVVKGKYPADSTWSESKTVPDYQQIDHSKLVPLLVSALQEAILRIEALEAQP